MGIEACGGDILMLESIQELLKPISRFFYLITHPKVVFNWIVSVSYWLVVLISITSLLFFIATKSNKARQILGGTILAYILLKAIASVI